MGGHIFISYSHRDADYVHRLTRYLTEQGLRVWTDQGIELGAEWVRTIEEQIKACAVFVPVMSPHSQVSRWVTNEILLAQELGKPIMPLLLAGRRFTALLSVQHEDVLDGRLPSARYVAELARLCGVAVRSQPPAVTAAPVATAPPPVVAAPPVPAEPAVLPPPMAPGLGRSSRSRRQLVAALATVVLVLGGAYGASKAIDAWMPDPRQTPTGTDGQRVLGHSGSVFTVVWSPDGGRVATAGSDNTRIWNAETASAVHVIDLATDHVAWSPDGDRLALAGSPAQIWDAATGQRLQRLGERVEDYARDVLWEPAGTRLATVGTKITIWNADTGQPIRTLAEDSEIVTAAAWSPTGGRLATGGYDNTVRVWDPATGQSVVLTGHSGRINDLAWSPDGTTLASVSDDDTLRIWDPSTGQSIYHGDNGGDATVVVWSPDGGRLATAGIDNTVRIWDIAAGQSPVHTLTDHSGRINALAWSPQGLATASGDETVRIWDTDTLASVATLTGHTDDVLAVAWSPDGSALATGSADRTARLWPRA